MIQFEELKLSLEELEPDIKDLKEALGLEAMKKEIGELEEAQTSPDFWDDMEKSQKIIQRTSMLKNKVSAYETLVSGYEDALTLIEMGDEEEDLSILPDAQQLTHCSDLRAGPRVVSLHPAAHGVPANADVLGHFLIAVAAAVEPSPQLPVWDLLESAANG